MRKPIHSAKNIEKQNKNGFIWEKLYQGSCTSSCSDVELE